jgi:hypothetical protein
MLTGRASDQGAGADPTGPPGRVRSSTRRKPSEHRYLGRRFIRCRIRIVPSTAWIADKSSCSRQVSRSSMHSVASARHPSGVLRAARPARRSETGPGGPGARGGARRTGTGSHRGDMGAAGIRNAVRERCSRRPVPTAVGPRRSRSSQPAHARCIAATAFRRVADVAQPRGPGRPAGDGSPTGDVVRRPVRALAPPASSIHPQRPR